MSEQFDALLRIQGDASGATQAVSLTKQAIANLVEGAVSATQKVAMSGKEAVASYAAELNKSIATLERLHAIQAENPTKIASLSGQQGSISANQITLEKELTDAQQRRTAIVASLATQEEKLMAIQVSLSEGEKTLEMADKGVTDTRITAVAKSMEYSKALSEQELTMRNLVKAEAEVMLKQQELSNIEKSSVTSTKEYQAAQMGVIQAVNNYSKAATELELAQNRVDILYRTGKGSTNAYQVAVENLALATDKFVQADTTLTSRVDMLPNAMRAGITSTDEYKVALDNLNLAQANMTRAAETSASREARSIQVEGEKALAEEKLAEAIKNVEVVMQSQLTLTNELAAAEDKLANAQKLLGTTDQDIKTYELAVNENRTKLVSVTNELKAAEQQLADANKAESIAVRELEQNEKNLAASATQVEEKQVKAAKNTEGAWNSAFATVGTHVAGLAVRLQGAQIGLAGLGAGLTAVAMQGKNFLTSAIMGTADFEKSITTTMAIMGTQFKGTINDVRQLALGFGRDTQYTADQAAGAMQTLIVAGMSWDDVAHGGAKATLDLAGATGEDLTSAAGVATTAMNIYSMKASELPGAMDVITKAVNSSKISIHDFSNALVNVGPISQELNIPFADVAKLIAILGNVGVAGGTAGTALRSFFLNMVPRTQTAFNAMNEFGLIEMNTAQTTRVMTAAGISQAASLEGLWAAYAKGKGLTIELSQATDGQISGMEKWAVTQGALQSKFMDTNGDLTDMAGALKTLYLALKPLPDDARLQALTTIFKDRGGSKAAAPIMDMFDQIDQRMAATGQNFETIFTQIETDMKRSGGAAEIQAQIMNTTLAGSIKQFKGSWDAMIKTIAVPFQVPMMNIIDALKDKVNQFTKALDDNPKLAQAVGYILAFATAIASVTGPLALMLAAWSYMSPAIAGVGLALVPILAILGAITVVGLGFAQAFTTYSTGLTSAFNSVMPSLNSLMSGLSKFGQFIYTNIIGPLADGFARFLIVTLIPDLGKLALWFEARLPAMASILDRAINQIVIPALREAWKIINEDLVPVLGKLLEAVLAVGPGFMDGFATAWGMVKGPMEAVGNILRDTLVPAFGWVKDNGNAIGTVIGFIAGAMSINWAATKLATIWTTAYGVATTVWSLAAKVATVAQIAFGVAVGIFTGQLTIAEAALFVFDLALGPVVLVIAAITAALIAGKLAWDDYNETVAKGVPPMIAFLGEISPAWKLLGNQIAESAALAKGALADFGAGLPAVSAAWTKASNDGVTSAQQVGAVYKQTFGVDMPEQMGIAVKALDNTKTGEQQYADAVKTIQQTAADSHAKTTADIKKALEDRITNLNNELLTENTGMNKNSDEYKNWAKGINDQMAAAGEALSLFVVASQKGKAQAVTNASDAAASAMGAFKKGIWDAQTPIQSAVITIRNSVGTLLGANILGAYAPGYTLFANWGNGMVDAGNQALNKVTAIYNQIAAIVGLPLLGAKKVSNLGTVNTSQSTLLQEQQGIKQNAPANSNTGYVQGLDAQGNDTSDIKNVAYTIGGAPVTPIYTPGSGYTLQPSGTSAFNQPNGVPAGSAGSTKTAAQTAAEAVKAVAESITQGIKAFKDISSLVVPSNLAEKATQFANAATTLIMAVQKVALQFTDPHLVTIGAFGDAGNKVVTFLTSFVALMQTLNKPEISLSSVVDKVNDLIGQARKMMLTLADAVYNNKDGPGWNTDNVTLVGEFADAGGKATAFLSAFVDFVKKINGPDFSLGPVVDKVTTLIKQAHIMMNLLGSAMAATADGPGWTDDNVAALAGWVDAGTKAVGFVSAFTDLTQKLNGPNFILGPVVAKVTDLVKQAHIMMNQFGFLIGKTPDGPGWTADNALLVGQVADAGVKVVSFISTFADATQKILSPSFNLSNVVERARNLESEGYQIMDAFKGLNDPKYGFTPDALVIMGSVADTGVKVMAAVSALVDAIQKVAQNTVDPLSLTSKISAIIVAIYNTLTSVRNILSLSWTSGNIGEWADSGLKVISVVTTMVDALAKLAADRTNFNSLDLQTHISNLLVLIYNTVANVRNILDLSWTSGNMGEWADTGVKVLAAIGTTIDTIIKLSSASINIPSPATIAAIANSAFTFFDEFSKAFDAAIQLDKDTNGSSNTLVSGVSDTVTKVIGAVSAAYDAILKLSTSADTFAANPDQFIAPLMKGVTSIVQGLKDIMPTIGPLLDSLPTDLLTKLPQAISSIAGAFDIFTKLSTFTGVANTSIDLFRDSMVYLLQQIPAIAAVLGPEALNAASEFGAKMGPAMAILGTALDLFKSLMGDTGITTSTSTSLKGTKSVKTTQGQGLFGFNQEAIQASIDMFKNSLIYLLKQIPKIADTLGPEALKAASAFGTKIAPALDALMKALDLFKGLGGTRDAKGVVSGGLLTIDPKAIGALVGDLYTLLHHWHNLIIGGEFQGDFGARSIAFANIVSLVIGAISGLMGALKTMKDNGGADQLTGILLALASAMSKAASPDTAKILTAFGNLFSDLTGLFTEMNDKLNAKSPLYQWGSQANPRSFLGQLLFSVDGKAVGIRWWIYQAFQGMFQFLWTLFQEWGSKIVRYWNVSVLGQMKLDTAAFVKDIAALFNGGVNVPGTSGGGNNNNPGGGGNQPGNPGFHGPKSQSVGEGYGNMSSQSTHYNVRQATFVTDNAQNRNYQREMLRRASNPA